MQVMASSTANWLACDAVWALRFTVILGGVLPDYDKANFHNVPSMARFWGCK